MGCAVVINIDIAQPDRDAFSMVEAKGGDNNVGAMKHIASSCKVGFA